MADVRIGNRTYPGAAPSFDEQTAQFFRQQFPAASDDEIAAKVQALNYSMDAPKRAAAAQAVPEIPVNKERWEAFLAAQPRSKNIIDRR